MDTAYAELAITVTHILRVGTLEVRHKDPFDRLLIAQALAEGITLLTADRSLARYGAPVLLVLVSRRRHGYRANHSFSNSSLPQCQRRAGGWNRIVGAGLA